MKQFVRLFGVLALAFLMGAGPTIQAEQKDNRPFIVVRVTKVDPTMGFWSGITASFQEFDGIVTRSTTARFKVGDSLEFHVALIYHPLKSFPDILTLGKPELDPKKVAVGNLVRIAATRRCLAIDAGQLIADAECIRPKDR